ncbi:polysaccharide biosynthesis/export family protein, partial [Aliivibrio kagoshimensis]|uniref:polysaccharide biosynthesis/export family protein n=1 Tax=Aliivibrio kagoshimensis TaxID=2910230 RepID=UPI003D0E8C6A
GSFFATADDFESTYQLGAGDKIQIQVYGETDLSINELLISSSGTFDFPYLGQLTAKRKTLQQLKTEIQTGLKGDYLINPKVMVNILSFRQIYVNGEVKKPGGYEYQPGLTVEKAIALAGGFTDRASRSSIKITKAAKNSKELKGKLSTMVSPGDIIVIEQSFF